MSESDIVRYARQLVKARAVLRNAAADGLLKREIEDTTVLCERIYDGMVAAVEDYEKELEAERGHEQSATPDSYWWCEYCKRELIWVEVTYEERHDPRVGGCGESVVWRERTSNEEREQSALALLRHISEILEELIGKNWAMELKVSSTLLYMRNKIVALVEGKTNPLAEVRAEIERLKAALADKEACDEDKKGE